MMFSRTDQLPILVVDDDAQMLRTIADILRFRGYAPVSAATARDGLALAGDMPAGPAVALVDLRLPDMDGIELISRLHSLSELTEVVILTGNASVESAVRALREQSYDYLIKPVQPDQLLSSIGRAGDRWQRRRAEAALVESEDRLRRVFEHVSDALFITDDGDAIIDANGAALSLTGRSAVELRSARLSQLLVPAITAGASAMERSGEYRLRHTDGTVRVVDVRTAAFAPGLYVHTVRDLSLQRRLEVELNHAQRMEAVGRLAGGVAHDFNNMLTAIMCYSEMLHSTIAGGPGTDDLNEIVSAARRAAALTSQLLAFSRKQILQPAVLDLNDVVRAIEKMLQRLLTEDISLMVDPGANVWPVRADCGQMEQVILNLVVNARDAMSTGGTIRITTANLHAAEPRVLAHDELPPGDYVDLAVQDTGEGIDDDTLAHIFEPFFTTKAPGKGTGLGLSTVYGIARQTGGFIDVDTVRGAGTTFHIYLPRTTEPAVVTIADRTVHHAAAAARVLLVEDEPALRELISRILTSAGHTVRWARNGEEALAIASNPGAEIDLVLTDVVMPGMTGRDVAARIRSARPGVRVLYMSGHTSDDVLRRGVLHSHDDFLQKPFTSRELLQGVDQALRARQ